MAAAQPEDEEGQVGHGKMWNSTLPAGERSGKRSVLGKKVKRQWHWWQGMVPLVVTFQADAAGETLEPKRGC